MIVKLTCSYAGEFREIYCVTSFPVDWLTKKLAVSFGLQESIMKYTLEGSYVKGGVISDYVRGKQLNAFVEVLLSTDSIERTKCFVRYGSFVRALNAKPESSLFDIVSNAFSYSYCGYKNDLSPTCILQVDGRQVNSSEHAKECLHYGSVIEVIKLHSVPLPSPPPTPKPEVLPSPCITFRFPENIIHKAYDLTPTLPSLIHYCSTYLDIAPAFLRLSSASDQELTELTLSESLQSPIFVTIHLAIRDSLGKTHHYSPSFIDLVSSIVTDIQNCPFIRLPMKITKNGEDCDDNLPIWNLLSDAEDSSVFRATERTEDIECVLLTEEYSVMIDNKVFGMIVVDIPKDAVLCVEEEQPEDSGVVAVEYSGYHNILIPSSLCCDIPEEMDITYETPIVKRACTGYDGDCPFQLAVKCNHEYMIERENDNYYYGYEVNNEEKKGWIEKALLF